MKNLMKKTALTLLVAAGVAASAGAFAEKVIVKKGCNRYGCHYTKKVVRHHNGKKIVDTLHCHNGNCKKVVKKVKHKADGSVVIKKKICKAGHCEKVKIKRG